MMMAYMQATAKHMLMIQKAIGRVPAQYWTPMSTARPGRSTTVILRREVLTPMANR